MSQNMRINNKILSVAVKYKVWRFPGLRCSPMTFEEKPMYMSDPSQEGVMSSPPLPFMRHEPYQSRSFHPQTFAVKPISPNLLRNCLVSRQIWGQCYHRRIPEGRLTSQRREALPATSSNCPQCRPRMGAQ